MNLSILFAKWISKTKMKNKIFPHIDFFPLTFSYYVSSGSISVAYTMESISLPSQILFTSFL